jgi:hypothetical protein
MHAGQRIEAPAVTPARAKDKIPGSLDRGCRVVVDPEIYRKEAERAQRLAIAATTPALQRQWAKLAEAYIRLAEAAEVVAMGETQDKR